MPTLGELQSQFFPNDDDHQKTASEQSVATGGDGEHNKTASGGNQMTGLTDLYLAMTDMDKTAAHAAVNQGEEEIDFDKLAGFVAEAEVNDLMAKEAGEVVVQAPDAVEHENLVKMAALEHDAAGRIAARGFWDEFQKLAGAMDTDVSPNQTTETPSQAATPALGDRGLPTMTTNFAGSENHDKIIQTGLESKQVYKDSLKPSATIKPGVTGDDPETASESVGVNGGTSGFATVRDIMVGA